MEIKRMSFPEPWPEVYFKKLYKEHPQDFHVADFAGKVVSYILGYAKPNKSGSIKTLAVAPNFRRRGIGKELVNFIIQRLKEKNVKEFFLHTRTKNREARSFYKKLGFSIIKIVKKYYRNGDDDYSMKLSLHLNPRSASPRSGI